MSLPEPLARSIGSLDSSAALFAQRCRQCEATTFPVSPRCARCGGVDLDRVTLSDRATVFSWTAIRRAAAGMRVPYVVALADFPEGPRIFAQVDAAPERMRTGMAVRIAFGAAPAGAPTDAYYFVPIEP